MIDLPKFLIVRFAPGAAGNFLSAILQCSAEVAHLSNAEQQAKPDTNWLEYFKTVFKHDFKRWLDNEPNSQFNWGTRNIFSQSYERGNRLSAEEFCNLEKQHCDDYYFQCKKDNLLLPINWHKNFMPEYFNNSVSITVNLDQNAVRWYNHAVYKKKFIVHSTGTSEVLVEHLDHRQSISVGNFNNEYYKTYSSFRSFVQQNIINNKSKNDFLNLANIDVWANNKFTIDLSEILDQKKFTKIYPTLCKSLSITPLDISTIEVLHSYWSNCNEF